MLDKTQLSTEISNATFGKTSASSALSAMGDAISDYVKGNAVVNFSWIAQNPSSDPDPTTTATGGIVELDVVLTPSGVSDKGDALSYLNNEITLSFIQGKYNITDSGFITTAQFMADIPAINIEITITDDRNSAMFDLAGDIIDWIKAYIPATPCPGSHGVYVGAGTPLLIY